MICHAMFLLYTFIDHIGVIVDIDHIHFTLHSHDWVKEQLEKPVAKGKDFMFIKDTAFGIDGYYDKLPQVKQLYHMHIRIYPSISW